MDNAGTDTYGARMHTRQLGQSALEITPIGLGAWAIGGAWRFGWGPQDDNDSIAAINRAIAQGINWIDTAPAYGLGRSETVVGRALRDVPAGERPYVFTKCSLVWDDAGTVTHSLRPGSIRAECEASLKRLGAERIDLYQIHWPKWPSAPADHDAGRLEDAWHTMSELRREGKVWFLGASNFDTDQLARVHAIAPVTSLQPPYSMLRRDVEHRELPWCREHGVGAIVYSPMQSGLLSGKMTRERIAALPADDWRRNATWFQEPQLTTALAVVDVLRDIAGRHRRTVAEVAVAWVLQHPGVTGAIVGARHAGQVDEFARAGEATLDESDLARIDAALLEPRHVR
jgi:aryl-alcohol dehydrogenase-like predicted oxidoreductase